jgi:DNA polymerase epsilon subunit 1
LITNRTVVSEDVEDFEYTPKPEYEGTFTIFNEEDEKAVLEKWCSHMRETKPLFYVSFNGDSFDWPFIEERAKNYAMTLDEEVGVYQSGNEEYRGRFAIHMDCLYWVKRDAYLP